MRAISAGLAVAQAVRSPRWEVTLAAEAMGQMPGAPMVAWEEVVSNAGQAVFKPVACCSVASADSLLWFRVLGGAVQKALVSDPTDAADWTGATWGTLLAVNALALCALRQPGTQVIRLFVVWNTNSVYYIQSSNNGSTWGSPVLVYGGGDAVGDLVAGYIADGTVLHGPWFVGFSTYNGGTGQYSAKFVRNLATTKDVATYGPDWRAAGIIGDAPAATRHVCAVFRAAGQGATRVRLLDNLSGTFSNARDIDQTAAGLGGLHLLHARYSHLPELGITMGLVGEGAYQSGSYVGVAGVFSTDSVLVADEGIILDGLVNPRDTSMAVLAETTVSGDLYAVGDTGVWRGAAVAAPATLPRPISYRYDDGQMELKLPVDSGAALLRPGMLLTVTRTARWNSDSGSEALRLVVVRVEIGTDGTRVVANDALAYLGSARCRRPAIGNDGSAAGVAEVMRKLAGRFGVPLVRDNAALEAAAVMPITLMPSESLRGAAYRVGSQAEFYLLPRANAWGLEMITPGTSASGQHDDTAQALGLGEGVLWKAAEIREWRRLAFSYILGSFSTDPADGGVVAMASGRPEPGTRPISYSFTNLRYNSKTRVEDAAAAEALRQADASPAAVVTINGHLGLELYDVVEVTEGIIGWAARLLRVRSITEEYDKGRLTMTLGLGDV